MTEHNDTIAFLPDRSYVIPGRLVKQLVEAAEPAPEPSAMEKLITFLDATNIQYSWEMHSCGDSSTAQVWFRPMGSWELVFEFDSETGNHTGTYLEG
jgi:hypothetical protein